jgi:hypothetical protein
MSHFLLHGAFSATHSAWHMYQRARRHAPAAAADDDDGDRSLLRCATDDMQMASDAAPQHRLPSCVRHASITPNVTGVLSVFISVLVADVNNPARASRAQPSSDAIGTSSALSAETTLILDQLKPDSIARACRCDRLCGLASGQRTSLWPHFSDGASRASMQLHLWPKKDYKKHCVLHF